MSKWITFSWTFIVQGQYGILDVNTGRYELDLSPENILQLQDAQNNGTPSEIFTYTVSDSTGNMYTANLHIDLGSAPLPEIAPDDMAGSLQNFSLNSNDSIPSFETNPMENTETNMPNARNFGNTEELFKENLQEDLEELLSPVAENQQERSENMVNLAQTIENATEQEVKNISQNMGLHSEATVLEQESEKPTLEEFPEQAITPIADNYGTDEGIVQTSQSIIENQ